MKRLILGVVFLFSFGFTAVAQLPKAAPIDPKDYTYSPNLTDQEYFDPQRIAIMPRESREAYRNDPRYDKKKIDAIQRKWRADHNAMRKSGGGATGAISSCYWVEPDNDDEDDLSDWTSVSDGYSPVINLGWNFNFFGQNFNQVVITTKGQILLGNVGVVDFVCSAFPTPSGGESTEEYDQIAGFWTDSDFSTYGQLFVVLTDEAFIVTFDGIGCFGEAANITNTFQIIMTPDDSDFIGGGNNVRFVYKDMQYVHSYIGNATDGCGATNNLANVGCDRIAGSSHYAFGRFGHCDNDTWNGPYGTNANQIDGVDWLDNRMIEFNAGTTETNTMPAAIQDDNSGIEFGPSSCDTMFMCQGEVDDFFVGFVSGAANQTLTITVTDAEGLETTTAQATNGGQIFGTFTAGENNVGTNTITVTGTDNGVPANSLEITYVYVVSEGVAPPITIEGVLSICAGGETTLTASDGFEEYFWSNGAYGQSATFEQNGPISVTGALEGCESIGNATIDVTPYFIPQLEGGNEPIVMCPGEDTTICVLGDWAAYEWFIYPGYDGEFVPGAPLDEACTQVTGNIDGNYGILVTDEDGCQGFNIKLIDVTGSYIDPINDENEGAYCDGLESVDFTGGYSNPAEGAFLVYGLSTNQNGWLGAFAVISVYEPGSDEPDATYNFTIFNPFTIFDDVEIGVGDSIVVEYFANGNNTTGNTIWLVNCGEIDPMIFTSVETGVIWSGLSTCTSEPLIGQWTVTGPPGWNLTDDEEFNTTFTPGDYGTYTLCFNDPACSLDHCYELEYSQPPSITMTPGQNVLLCANETYNVSVDVEDISDNAQVTWSGDGVDPSGDMMSAVLGPYNDYVTTTITATATNGCGSSSDSFTLEYQPLVPTPQINNQLLCSGASLVLDPIPSGQDNPALEYDWSNGSSGSTLSVSSSGTYSVTVSNECDESEEVSASISIVPDATIISSPAANITECNEDLIVLTVNYQQPQNYSIEWSNGSSNNAISVDTDGQYCWTITDNQDCGTEVTGCVNVNMSMVPSAAGGSGEADILCPGECMELNMAVSGDDLTYSWTTSCNGYPVNQNDGSFNFCSDNVPVSCLGGAVSVTGTATNGCGTDQASWVLVPSGCELLIPNVITPDGDGKNDTFEIFGLENYRDVQFQIFNRWGNKVFETTNYDNSWSASDVAAGTYFYVIILPFGLRTEYEGHFTVLKPE